MSKSIDLIKKKIKDRMVYLALGAAVLAGGGKASANPAPDGKDTKQTTKETTYQINQHPSDPNAIYYDNYRSGKGSFTQTHSAEENLEPSLYFAPEKLAEAVGKANLTDEQTNVFINAYMSSVDKDMKITKSDLLIVFDRAGVDKEKIKVMMGVLMPEKEKTQQNVKQSSAEDIVWHDVNSKHVKGHYAFTSDNKFLLKVNTFSMDPTPLMQKTKILEDGRFQCGSTIGDSHEWVVRQEKDKIRNIMTILPIYNDVKKRGETEVLNQNEQRFVQNYPKSLKAHGLKINDDGELAKTSSLQKGQNANNILYQNINSGR